MSDAFEAMAVHGIWTRSRCGSVSDDIEIDVLVAAQGFGTISDTDDLAADFWPSDDPDELLSELRQLRRQGAPRELP